MSEASETSETAEYVVEQGHRLSESMLWQLQRELYDRRGIQAWSAGTVPQTITTTPYIARAYARVVLGYLRDVSSELDPAQPLYIVELGAGTGRFGYRFVKHLTWLLEEAPVGRKSFTYVMTEVAPSLIDYWQSHPRLQPLVEAGVLDFALFDATQPAELTLTHAGIVLNQGSVVNPLVVIGNYFFDSIPHDCFSIQDKQLQENLVRVTSSRPLSALENEDNPLASLQISFDVQPAQADYYADTALNHVLAEYLERLDNIMFLLPVAGMACVRHFQALAGGRALILGGDIGSARESDLGANTSGGLGADSHFWLSVNFHALGLYVEQLGGRVLHPPFRHASLNVSAFVLGGGACAETALAYADAIGQTGPDDAFVVWRMIVNHVESLSRGELFVLLHAVAWDTDYVLMCMPYLMDSLQEVSWSGRQDLRKAAAEAWEMYYPMGEGDLAFALGVLLYTLGEYADALSYFLHSLELFGSDARTTFNVALCLYRSGRAAEALEWLDRTLELDPASDQALEMRRTLSR